MASLLSFLFTFLVILPSLLVECLELNLYSQKKNAAVIPPRPIKRVAIIGCGIAGLTLAHALENSVAREQSGVTPSKIQSWLFDSRPSLDFQAGAGVQLNGGELIIR